MRGWPRGAGFAPEVQGVVGALSTVWVSAAAVLPAQSVVPLQLAFTMWVLTLSMATKAAWPISVLTRDAAPSAPASTARLAVPPSGTGPYRHVERTRLARIVDAPDGRRAFEGRILGPGHPSTTTTSASRPRTALSRTPSPTSTPSWAAANATADAANPSAQATSSPGSTKPGSPTNPSRAKPREEMPPNGDGNRGTSDETAAQAAGRRGPE